MNKEWIKYAVVFLAGVMLAGQVRKLPLMNKLPSV
jgi:hypothetical protein